MFRSSQVMPRRRRVRRPAGRRVAADAVRRRRPHLRALRRRRGDRRRASSARPRRRTGRTSSPELLLAFFLGQLLYDVAGRRPAGVYSALRGHSLARTHVRLQADQAGLNHDAVQRHRPAAHRPGPLRGPVRPRRLHLVNYTYFPADGFLRDPERPGVPAAARAGRTAAGPYTGGFNVAVHLPRPEQHVPGRGPGRRHRADAVVPPALDRLRLPRPHRLPAGTAATRTGPTTAQPWPST